jgi:hypothetical protein
MMTDPAFAIKNEVQQLAERFGGSGFWVWWIAVAARVRVRLALKREVSPNLKQPDDQMHRA